MKLFISWSGEISHKVALILREWIPSVIQSVEPYVSSEDIDKGARWSIDIAAELNESFYGILCITKDNIESPWINFEAGALSKSVDRSKVSPFLFDVKRSDIKSGPLLQFQSTVIEQEDVLKLLSSINNSCTPQTLDDMRLNTIFAVWWPKLHDQLNEISQLSINTETEKNVRHKDSKELDILEEVLELSRQISRKISSPSIVYNNQHYHDVPSKSRASGTYNPVFEDLIDSWEAFQTKLSRFNDDDSLPRQLIMESIEDLERPITYIARSYSRRNQQDLFEFPGTKTSPP